MRYTEHNYIQIEFKNCSKSAGHSLTKNLHVICNDSAPAIDWLNVRQHKKAT